VRRGCQRVGDNGDASFAFFFSLPFFASVFVLYVGRFLAC
jgi:hypothetical protein